MKQVFNFWTNVFVSQGKPSSKRVVTFLAFILMATGFIANLFFGKQMDANIYESMMWIVMGGLGFTASETMFKKNTEIPIQPPI